MAEIRGHGRQQVFFFIDLMPGFKRSWGVGEVWAWNAPNILFFWLGCRSSGWGVVDITADWLCLDARQVFFFIDLSWHEGVESRDAVNSCRIAWFCRVSQCSSIFSAHVTHQAFLFIDLVRGRLYRDWYHLGRRGRTASTTLVVFFEKRSGR